ncbi:SusC/RagA family TonB-linked outer membrane protein [Flavicella sediminum]|uniref:SusC/RagA family TonB-linked outer membrane protein n=1 Tax=Flavicella sediminum TaxID=2585141 RepID=UPI001FB7E298|nr:TonB-dependent receptor [Flavicella sediminum]
MKKQNLFRCKITMSRFLLVAILSLLCFNANAQQNQITVTGTVIGDSDALPIPGVTILIKGTQKGTSSDFDGLFSIKTEMGATLTFNYVGMEPQEVKVTSATMAILLKSSVDELEEVVVVGYGTVKKKELTGAVAQVKAEQIEAFVTPDLASALQGQVSGVNITAASGEPGEQASIQIRGVTSLVGSNEPLFVVDGIAQQGNPGLSPNEIQSIDVLKDAASAAIYGSEGAGGVILITTKRGKEGKMSVTLNTTYGVQTLRDGIQLMDTKESLFYATTRYENGATPFVPGPVRNANWINNNNTFDGYVLINNADTKQHTLNVTGGTKNFSYNAVVGYFEQQGTLINSGFRRINGRTTTSYTTDNWKINTSLAFTTEKRERSSNGLIVNALRYTPYYPIVDPDSDVVYTNGNGGVTTPLDILARALKKKDNSTRDRINASLSVTRNFGENLTAVATVGTAITADVRNQFTPKYTVIDLTDNTSEVDPTKSFVQVNTGRITTLSSDFSLRYKKKFGDHNIGAQTTFAIKEEGQESIQARQEGVANNNISVLNGATINPSVSNGANFDNTLIGVLGRITYDYKGKYLFSGLVRRDGSSKFGTGYKWGTFPSVSFAWNISDEDFWSNHKSVVNNFKFRISRGTVGNNRITPYSFSSGVDSSMDYIFDENDANVSYGNAVKSYATADLIWETKTETNIGVDLAFLKNKFSVSVDYYDARNKDMLFPDRLPGSAGAYYSPNVVLNIGNMTNKGLEIAGRYRAKIGKSRLDLRGTFSKNVNEITKTAGSTVINNANSTLISGDPGSITTVLAEGYEIGSFFLYETNGVIKTEEQLAEYQKFPSRVNAKLGDLIFVDHDESGDIDDADRHYLGSALPDFEYGINLRWSYKNFDVSTNWYGTVGAELMNGNKAAAYTYGRHKDLVNQWSVDNPTSNIPLNRGGLKEGSFNYIGSTDYWLENGDYLRLKLVTMGYSIPKNVCEKMGATSLRLFLTAQNPLTFTNYSGYDPEVGGNVTRRGLDVSRYPVTALYTLGLNLKF